MAIGSDLSAGVAALVRMFAHNASAADFTGFQAQMTVTDATAASEDVSVAIQTMAAGTLDHAHDPGGSLAVTDRRHAQRHHLAARWHRS